MEKLVELGYETNAFEGVINKETFEIHHGKHVAAYVANFNAAVEGSEYDNMDLNDILANISTVDESIRAAVQNNGGGISNHNLYFAQFGRVELQDGEFKDLVVSTFGSVEALLAEIKTAGLTRFGSGWAWLVLNDGKLEVTKTLNQDSPISLGQTPLIGIDVWEHAYYLDFQNRRPDYLDQVLTVLDWSVIEARYNAAK